MQLAAEFEIGGEEYEHEFGEHSEYAKREVSDGSCIDFTQIDLQHAVHTGDWDSNRYNKHGVGELKYLESVKESKQYTTYSSDE